MDVVANATNSVDFLLKDYELVFKYATEGYSAPKPVEDLIKFTRTSRNQVPLMNGPTSSNNCPKLAPILQHVNYVGIGGGCSGAISLTARRDLAPNFYRPMISAEMSALLRIKLAKDIGKWSKISILANNFRAFDYNLAIATYENALNNAVKVSFFDLFSSVTPELVANLKRANSRIIFFDVSPAEMIVEFLC